MLTTSGPAGDKGSAGVSPVSKVSEILFLFFSPFPFLLPAAVGSVGGVVNALDFNVKIKNIAAYDPQGGQPEGIFPIILKGRREITRGWKKRRQRNDRSGYNSG